MTAYKVTDQFGTSQTISAETPEAAAAEFPDQDDDTPGYTLRVEDAETGEVLLDHYDLGNPYYDAETE